MTGNQGRNGWKRIYAWSPNLCYDGHILTNSEFKNNQNTLNGNKVICCTGSQVDVAPSSAGLWWKCEATDKWQKPKCFALHLSPLRTMTHRWCACRMIRSCDYIVCLDGGFIVWCMMLKTEHNACWAAAQPLGWKMWFVCNTELKKNPKNNKMSRGTICEAQTPKAHLRHDWAPKCQISSRQPGALLHQAGLKKNILYFGTGGARGSCWSSRMWLWGCLIWLYDVSLWTGSTTRRLWWTAAWQHLQMSSLHMHGPWHVNATQSITHRQQRLSDFGFAAPLSLPSHLPFAVSPMSHSSLSCRLSSPALAVFLCSLSTPLLPPQYLSPSLPSLSLNIFPFSATSADAGLLKDDQNAFTLREALHLTAGAEAGLTHPQREKKKPVLESHNCEVKQCFGSTWRNMFRRKKLFHEQFALLKLDS